MLGYVTGGRTKSKKEVLFKHKNFVVFSTKCWWLIPHICHKLGLVHIMYELCFEQIGGLKDYTECPMLTTPIITK